MNGELEAKENVLELLYAIQEDKGEEGSKYKLLNEKFEDLSDTKLPELTNELIKKIGEAGVQPQLLPEQGQHLMSSLNEFINATQKRGI